MNNEIKQKILFYIGSIITSLGIMIMCIFMFESLFFNIAIGVSFCGIGSFISAKVITDRLWKVMKEKGKSKEKR
ncbi:hypothetical protein [Lactococcus formosensis]|uniref:hypothetical protein n=1 Tax=Lactococcus formosensis TaxID=1281486 RepID=UPI000BBAF6AE|nr:hypothetical protein [Lactococcus formosensis]